MRFTDCEALARMVPLTCKRPRIVTLTETVCDKLYAADTDAEKPSNNACGSSPKYLELSGRGAHVIDQCGLVLVTFNKHANWQEADDMLAELLDAVGAALAVDPRKGG
jgi:hypothetical protein